MDAENLVTGGCGFIGSNLVRMLVEEGRTVRILDNLATGNPANVQDLIRRGGVELVHGDVRDLDAVRAACQGVQHVFHFAALPSVIGSVEAPGLSNAVNLDGTVNLLMAARDAKARRFVFSSSSAIYGDSPELPKRENMLPAPLSPYGVQKLSGEYYCRIFRDLYGLPAFVLRYFNVFGPRQNPRSQYAAVIPLFIEAVRDGHAPVIYGDGKQTRDFVFVEDVARANLCCRQAPESAAGGIYNIACGTSISVNQLAETVARVMGRPDLRARHEPARAGDVRDSVADASRARSILEWKPKTSFEDGLKRTVDWFTHVSG